MHKTLIIAEKPSVAKDIAIALGGFQRVQDWLEREDIVISSAIGHLVEIYSEQASLVGGDLSSLPIIPKQFQLRPIERTQTQFKLLARLMKRNDITCVVNACDAGREGELIFRLIYEHAGCQKPTKRMWFQTMTTDGIREAYKHAQDGSRYDDLGDAARSRSEADWLIGINGSRAVKSLKELQTNSPQQETAGRVQTPTLAIVVDLENKITSFVPEDYWEIHGIFEVGSGRYTGKWYDTKRNQPSETDLDSQDERSKKDRFFDRSKAEQILAKVSGKDPDEVLEETKPVISMPPKLFDLTTLQRESNKRFGFSAKQTLDIAQALYEKHKCATYPRTDSQALPEDYIPKVLGTIRSLISSDYRQQAEPIIQNSWVKPTKRVFDNSKISDHFAIIPTGVVPGDLSPQEKKVFDLIVKRFLAIFYPQAEYAQTVRITKINDESFRSVGKVLVSEGWLSIYGRDVTSDDEKDKSPPLAKYEQGELVKTNSVELKSLKTKAPPRMTEAGLLLAMETAGKLIEDDDLRDAMSEKGLGTPATRASIIEGLLSTDGPKGTKKVPYLKRDGKFIVPTQKGSGLITFLRSNGIEILTSPKMTGEWEYKLTLMSKGSYQRSIFIEEISSLTMDIISKIKGQAKSVKVASMSSKCPKCGGEISIKPRAFECSAACGFYVLKTVASRPMQTSEVEELISKGKSGPFDGFVSKLKKKFSASLVLKDDHSVGFSFDSMVVNTDPDGNMVTCPDCDSEMRRIKGGSGYFWGCKDRSGCGATLADNQGWPVRRPKSVPCDQCGKAMILKSGAGWKFWGCTGYKPNNKGCNNRMDDVDGKPVKKERKLPDTRKDNSFL